MKASTKTAARAVADYLLYSPKAHAVMVTLAIGAFEAVRTALGTP